MKKYLAGEMEKNNLIIGEEITEEDGETDAAEALAEFVRQNGLLIDFIKRNYKLDPGRIRLLCSILEGMGCRREEELKGQIYLYGSMLKGRDLIPRQLFLWLSLMAEENHLKEELGSRE